MTQEEKELLLNDLSMRLLHDVRIHIESDWFEEELEPYDTTLSLDLFKYFVNSPLASHFIIKPYLRPMSSMTEQEIDKYHELFWEQEKMAYFTFCSKVTDYLNSIHVDYRGLIPKGLAIAVTEENNPYKNQEQCN